MKSVTISPKFQIVILREVREKLKLSLGQNIQVIVFGNRIELIPEQKIKKCVAFLKELMGLNIFRKKQNHDKGSRNQDKKR